MSNTSNDDDDPLCNRCGEPRSKHGLDPRTLEPVKCPVSREETTTPPQEHERSPSGDY
jgi:hypothetical protein